jgi:hypothetical protein
LKEWKVFAEDRALRALEGRGPDAYAAPVFSRLERLIPSLLAEMRQDLAKYPLVRECVLLEKDCVYNGEATDFNAKASKVHTGLIELGRIVGVVI